MRPTTSCWVDPWRDHDKVYIQVAQAHDNRWDAARHGAAGAAGLPAGSAADSRKRAQLPDWRPGGDWKKKPDAKRQKKVRGHWVVVCKPRVVELCKVDEHVMQVAG